MTGGSPRHPVTPRSSRSTSRRLVSFGYSAAFACTILSIAIWIGSIFFHLSLTGHPFNRSWTIRYGGVITQWTTPNADGSWSGLGSGWHFRSVDEHHMYLLPHLSHAAIGTIHAQSVPIWPLILLAAATTLRFRALHRRFRQTNVCSACGYSRLGLPQGVRCPECGRVPAASG